MTGGAGQEVAAGCFRPPVAGGPLEV